MPTPSETPVRPLGVSRQNGWTPQRRRLFFAALTAGHTVAFACGRVGLSREAAYKARRRDPEFARQWAEALHSALRAAEAALFEGLPENLRRALLARAQPGEFGGAEFSPQDRVNSVKRL